MPGAAPAWSAQAGNAEQKAAGVSGSGLGDQSAPFQTSLALRASRHGNALRASQHGKRAALGRKALAKPVSDVGDEQRSSLKYREDAPIAVPGGR